MGKKSKSYHLDIRANRKNPYGLLRHILCHAIKVIFFANFAHTPFAFLAVKTFYRKGRRGLRKVRKEKNSSLLAWHSIVQ